jgi:hypothetical protein
MALDKSIPNRNLLLNPWALYQNSSEKGGQKKGWNIGFSCV